MLTCMGDPAGCAYRDRLAEIATEDLKRHDFEVIFLHHVDDFRATGREWLDKLFEDGLNHYLKLKVGPTEKVGDRIGCLGRDKLRTEDAFITKADEKHTKAILQLLHFEEAKPVGSPGQKLVFTEGTKTPLSEEQASVYRSAV